MTNPFTLIPVQYRKFLYAAFAIAVAVDGALHILGVDDGATPQLLAYIGGLLGVTAASNATPNKKGR